MIRKEGTSLKFPRKKPLRQNHSAEQAIATSEAKLIKLKVAVCTDLEGKNHCNAT